MTRILLAAFLVLLMLAGACKLFDNNDDPDPYTGGTISNLGFEVRGPHSVKLTWSEDFPDEDGFYIDRKVWDGEWQRKILQVAAGDTTATDTTAELGTVYYYKVYAYKGDAESEEEETQYNFFLPYPYNVDYDYSWAQPNSMRLFWINQAPWADSIVVAKKIGGEQWTPHLAVLPGDAIEFIDSDYHVQNETSWGFTAYYLNQVSQQATITMMPPK